VIPDPPSGRRPSAALVISIIALVVALTGTGFAASHFIITSSKQVKPRAIKGRNIAKGTVGVANLARNAKPKAGKTGPVGPIGPAGRDGVDGAPGPATLPAAVGVHALLDNKDPVRTLNIPSGTPTDVPFHAIVFDTDGAFKPLISDTRLVVPRDGVYTITAQVEWDRVNIMAPTPGDAKARLTASIVNATAVRNDTLATQTTPYLNDQFASQSLAAVARLKAGESIRLNLFQDSSETQVVSSGDHRTGLAMVFDGP
jgi:hypothetical protein